MAMSGVPSPFLSWMDVGEDDCYEASLESLAGPSPLYSPTKLPSSTPLSDSKLSKSHSSHTPEFGSAEYWCLTGNVHFGRGEFMAAVDRFTRAIDVSSGVPTGSSGDEDSTTKHEDNVPPSVTPLDVIYLSNRSAAYFALGRRVDMQHSLRDAERCIAFLPQWPKGYLRKAVAARGLGQYSTAKAALLVGREVALRGAVAAVEDDGTAATHVDYRGLHHRDALPALNAALDELEKMMLFHGTEDAPDEDASSAPASGGEEDKFTVLEKWLLSRGTSTFPYLFMQKYSENNRGVHARSDVPPECQVMAIGKEFLITVEMARLSHYGRLLAAAGIDRDLSAAKHCYLAIFVLADRKYVHDLPFRELPPPVCVVHRFIDVL